MEKHFGHTFEDVRIRTDAADARSEQARAFTVGDVVTFAPGEYEPDTLTGQAMIAHELAHVVQQSGADPEGPVGAGTRADEVAADHAVASGDTRGLGRGGGLRLSRCDGKKDKTPRPASGVKPPVGKPPVKTVFERPGATHPGTVASTFSSYRALSADDRKKAFADGYASGNVKRALRALGPKKASDSFPAVTRDLLGRITAREGSAPFASGFLGSVESAEATDASGKTVDEMAKVQAKHEKSKAKPAKGWGGSAPGKTRWEKLKKPEQDAWTKRARAVIPKMVAYVNKTHPEFTVNNATFEWKPKEVDDASEGAVATVGSIPGKSVQVGFEFVVLAEMNLAYAMSTVAHELLGHAAYDEAGSNFQAKLYRKAKTKEAGLPSGTQTYDYWPSEIYSLMREAPYYTPVSATDKKKKLSVPGGKQSADFWNYAPDNGIGWHLDAMRARWHPDLLIPILKGFVARVRIDPRVKPAGLTAFETAVRRKFKKADADKILK